MLSNDNDNAINVSSLSSSGSPPCGACKFLRRRCVPECVFAPYFPGDNPRKFSDVHSVFGASNVSKILSNLDNPSHREAAANALAYEAECRLLDPVNGCVRPMFELEHIKNRLERELNEAKARLATYHAATAMFPVREQQQHHYHNISNYPIQTSGHMEFNLPNPIFNTQPLVIREPQPQPQQMLQHQQPQHYPQQILNQVSQQPVEAGVPVAVPNHHDQQEMMMRMMENLQPQYEFQQQHSKTNF